MNYRNVPLACPVSSSLPGSQDLWMNRSSRSATSRSNRAIACSPLHFPSCSSQAPRCRTPPSGSVTRSASVLVHPADRVSPRERLDAPQNHVSQVANGAPIGGSTRSSQRRVGKVQEQHPRSLASSHACGSNPGSIAHLHRMSNLEHRTPNDPHTYSESLQLDLTATCLRRSPRT